MNTSSAVTPSCLNRPRRMMVLLAVLFIAPVVAAFVLYYGARGWHPSVRVNHGDLITPAVPTVEAALATPEGKVTPAGFLRDKWSLIYLGAGACDTACRAALHELRQVRLSMAKDMDRIQAVFLYSGACCEQPYFANEQASLLAASTDSDAGVQLLRSFTKPAGGVYISDPLGNVMMHYPAGSDPKGLREDLKRLLKLSHIG